MPKKEFHEIDCSYGEKGSLRTRVIIRNEDGWLTIEISPSIKIWVDERDLNYAWRQVTYD